MTEYPLSTVKNAYMRGFQDALEAVKANGGKRRPYVLLWDWVMKVLMDWVSDDEEPCVPDWPIDTQQRTASGTLRRRVLEAHGHKCWRCGTKQGPFDMHHRHPWSQGGPTELYNLVPVCEPCHVEMT